MKNILFFGDSNTWGYTPGTGARYPRSVRYPGACEAILGADFHCIEDGISGRTTVFEDPWRGCRRGSDALDFALVANAPLDLLVIMLGTNDLKFADAVRSSKGIATLARMAETVDARCHTLSPVFPKGAKLLIIAPILIGPGEENNDEYLIMPNGHEESKKFDKFFKAVAETHNAAYINAAALAEPSPVDCQHLTEAGHRAIAEAVAKKIREIL